MAVEGVGGVDFPRPILDDAPRPPDRISDGPSFGDFLQNAVGDVNALQERAGNMVQRYATGERMDVHQVMIALEQASTAMALTVQVRNKVIDAYQEIMRTNL